MCAESQRTPSQPAPPTKVQQKNFCPRHPHPRHRRRGAGPVPAHPSPNSPTNQTPFCHPSGVRWETTGRAPCAPHPHRDLRKRLGRTRGRQREPPGRERVPRGTNAGNELRGAVPRTGTARRRPRAGRPSPAALTVQGNRPGKGTPPRAAPPSLSARGDPHDGNAPGPGPAAGRRRGRGRIQGRRPPRPGERGGRPKGPGARGQGPRPEPARPGVLPGRAREGPVRGGLGARRREAIRPDAARGGPRRAAPASAVVLDAAPPTGSGGRGRRRRGRLP